MKTASIIQFVGFVTDLEAQEFISAWEFYSKDFMTIPGTTTLLKETSTKSKYKYLSRHEFNEPELLFAFIKDRNSKYLKEQKIKVVQTGGYIAVQLDRSDDNETSDVKVMAFLDHSANNIDFYRKLASYKDLNIYQEYYENCLYGYILEFFAEEKDVQELLRELNAQPSTRAWVYKECVLAAI